jgi:hypothetical protein
VYAWLLTKRTKSKWAMRLAQYLEVMERKLIGTKQFREDTLTKFAGFPFSADEPYNYLEGKRLLNLAMDELRHRRTLQRKLGVNPKHKGRGAITGKRARLSSLTISFSKAGSMLQKGPLSTEDSRCANTSSLQSPPFCIFPLMA